MSGHFDFSMVAAKPAVVTGRSNTIDVLVRVQAPDPPATGLPPRPHLNLSIVIDRSGSMQGRPLDEAKRCANFMVGSLKKTDRVAIVAYDNDVRVVAGSQMVSDKDHLKSAIATIQSGGNTNLHGGWLKGAEEAAGHLASGLVSRVLLLSDGNANAGLTGIDEICSQCAQLAEAGVSTSTYGLGTSFNEELMTAIARSGRGNSYYSEKAESLLERFREEFSLLSSLCARSLRLMLSPLPGVRCEMLNLYDTGPGGAWCLPDLVYDGEAWAALRLTIAPSALPAVGETVALLGGSVTYQDLAGEDRKIAESWLSLKVVSEEQYRAVPVNEGVVRRVSEAEAAKLQELASRAARNHDWVEVDRLLREARRMAVNSPWLTDIVTMLERLAARQDGVLFSKEARYAATNMSVKMRSKNEMVAGFEDSAAPMHLQRRVRQGNSEIFNQSLPVISPARKGLETILEVGAEGGSLAVLGEQGEAGEWKFWVKRDETGAYEALSEEDREDLQPGERSGSVASLAEALQLLDKYPWVRLSPMQIHPDFATPILSEVVKRGGAADIARWERFSQGAGYSKGLSHATKKSDHAYEEGMIVESLTKPDWGPGKIVKVDGDKLHIIFRDLDAKSAKVFRKDAPTLRKAVTQRDPILDNLPPLIERGGAWELPQQRVTLASAKRKFLFHFPGGFHDPRYLSEEREYKVQAHRLVGERLCSEAAHRLLANSDIPALNKRCLAVIAAAPLISRFERSVFPEGLADLVAARQFYAALFDLLKASSPNAELFEAYVDALSALPAKRGKVATWPIATILPYLAQPERFMFLKPEVTRVAAEALAFDLHYHATPNWNTHAALIRLSSIYLELLKDLGARDFIDVQTFIFVIGGGYD